MLIYCKTCEHGCSDEAKNCPNCGARLRARKPPIWWAKLAGAAVVFMLGASALVASIWHVRDQQFRLDHPEQWRRDRDLADGVWTKIPRRR